LFGHYRDAIEAAASVKYDQIGHRDYADVVVTARDLGVTPAIQI
jgi:hypothetical protein